MGKLEFIKRDLQLGHAEIVEHFGHRLDHHRRAAEVVLDGFRIGVIVQVVLERDLVDEAGEAGPVVFRQGRGKSEMEGKVRM